MVHDCVIKLCMYVAKSVVVRDLDTVVEIQLAATELHEESVVFR